MVLCGLRGSGRLETLAPYHNQPSQQIGMSYGNVSPVNLVLSKISD